MPAGAVLSRDSGEPGERLPELGRAAGQFINESDCLGQSASRLEVAKLAPQIRREVLGPAAERGTGKDRRREEKAGYRFDGPGVAGWKLVLAEELEPGCGQDGAVRPLPPVLLVPGRNPVMATGPGHPVIHDPGHGPLPRRLPQPGVLAAVQQRNELARPEPAHRAGG